MGIVWKSEEVFIQETANKIKSDMKGKKLLYNLTVDMSLLGFQAPRVWPENDLVIFISGDVHRKP